MPGAITSIFSMNMLFIWKSMVMVKRHITMEFVLRDRLLMSLKFIIIGSRRGD
jgi:hypothetical protein